MIYCGGAPEPLRCRAMRREPRVAGIRRRLPAVAAFAVLVFAVGWVAYKAFRHGFGTTGDVPVLIPVLLNGISLAGLYFITASGFTLIFGLMRVVNMAHGSLYLFGGYLAYRLVGDGLAWWPAAL